MVWHADIRDGRIRVKTSYYSPRDTPYLREIPGGRWDPERKERSYPIDWLVCIGLREAATERNQKLEIGPALWDWATSEKARQESIPDVNSMDFTKLDNLPKVNPKLYEAVCNRPFQTTGVAFIARNREVLMADPPGLGKTIQTIGAFHEAMVTGPILVVAPLSAAVITWPHELRQWADGDKFGIIGAHLSAREREQALLHVQSYCRRHPDGRFWVITNVEYLRMRAELDEKGNYKYVKGKKILQPVQYALPQFFDLTWSGVVVDESHKYLAGNTGNKKKWSAQRVGLGALDLKDGALRVALSGTPFRGKKENLWGTLNWLRPHLYTSYWKWIDKHFQTYTDPMDHGATISSDELKDTKAFYEESANVMIRRSKEQVVKDLPPKMYAGWPLEEDIPNSPVAVWLEPTKEQKRQYDSILKMAEADLEGGTLMTYGVLSEITRLKQLSNGPHFMDGESPQPVPDNSNKFDWIKNWLEERGMMDENPGSDVGKVIIASQFTSFLNMMHRWFEQNNVPHHLLTGDTSRKKRVVMQEEFQGEDGPRIFMLNTTAGGVSLTLDTADDVIIIDQTTIADDQEQVEDRAHRISRMHQVTIWYLATLGSIDEAIAATTAKTEFELKDIMDGQRGVQFMKQLLEYKGRS